MIVISPLRPDAPRNRFTVLANDFAENRLGSVSTMSRYLRGCQFPRVPEAATGRQRRVDVSRCENHPPLLEVSPRTLWARGEGFADAVGPIGGGRGHPPGNPPAPAPGPP